MKLFQLVTSVACVLSFFAAPTRATPQQCCTGNISTYCTAGTSAQGCVPLISGQGTPSFDAGSGFDIEIAGLPPQRSGLILFGAGSASSIWTLGSTSYICVGSPQQRTQVQDSGGAQGACNGTFALDFNAYIGANPGATGGPFTAGQTFHAQGWYRDPGAPKQTNLSNGLQFTLCAGTGDTTPPSITSCPATHTISANSACQAALPDLTSSVIAIDNCSSSVVVSQVPAPGTVLSMGSTAVTLTCTDGSGNTAVCVTQVVVADTTGPTIFICASNQTVAAGSNCRAIVPDFTAGMISRDACSAPVTITQSPAVGSQTNSGALSVPVTITAMDAAGNTSSCAATLSVTQTAACFLPSGFVPIQLGTFQMGQVGVAQPVHSVTISYPFWMGAKEVTQAEYAALMGTNPSYFGGNANHPVEQVTWHNARSYCAALTAQQSALGAVPAGYEYRLPTEAEWEYACRAGTTTSWNVGNSLSCSQANHYSNGYCVGQTSVVGSYAPNAWGLYDMHGNVWEWCLDSYAGYSSSAVTDPFVTGGLGRVIRGGSWDNVSINCRSAFRDYYDPGYANSNIGVRVVLAPVLVP